MDVTFAVLPFVQVAQPSLACQFLASTVRAEDIGADVKYYNLEFARRIGLKSYTRFAAYYPGNELLLGENPLPPNFIEQPIGRVQAYTLGYDRDFDLIPRLATALGAQATIYGVGENLKPVYGLHPAGVAIFIRVRPFSGDER